MKMFKAYFKKLKHIKFTYLFSKELIKMTFGEVLEIAITSRMYMYSNFKNGQITQPMQN